MTAYRDMQPTNPLQVAIVPADTTKVCWTTSMKRTAISSTTSRTAGSTADADADAEIVIVSGNDVLLGRGGNNNQHAGNEQLRVMAQKYAPIYRAGYKREKPAIALQLVNEVLAMEPRGRFLKQGVSGWEVVTEEVAREKASQCLRDTVSVMSKLEPLACKAAKSIEVQRPRAASAPDFSAPHLKRPYTKPLDNNFVESQQLLPARKKCKATRQTASLSDLHRSRVAGVERIDDTGFFSGNISMENAVWGRNEETCTPTTQELACIRQAVLRMDELANDDAALHRLIDRMVDDC